jgi:hypothetical protein
MVFLFIPQRWNPSHRYGLPVHSTAQETVTQIWTSCSFHSAGNLHIDMNFLFIPQRRKPSHRYGIPVHSTAQETFVQIWTSCSLHSAGNLHTDMDFQKHAVWLSQSCVSLFLHVKLFQGFFRRY